MSDDDKKIEEGSKHILDKLTEGSDHADGVPEGLLFLSKLLAAQQLKNDEFANQLRRVGEFKEEMRDILNKTREANKELAAKNDAFIESANEVIQNVVTGVNMVEQRTNAMWNTLNTVIEWLKVNSPIWCGVLRTDLTDAAFIKSLAESGKALYEQAMAHRTAEIARIKAEKSSGANPQPMRPYPITSGDQVLAAVVGLTSVPAETPDEPDEGERSIHYRGDNGKEG